MKQIKLFMKVAGDDTRIWDCTWLGRLNTDLEIKKKMADVAMLKYSDIKSWKTVTD